MTSLRTIILRSRDEDLRNRLSKLHAGRVVHRIMNAGPDSRVTRLLTYRTNEVGMRAEQVGQYLGFGRRERGVI